MSSDNNILKQKGLYLIKPCTRKLIGFLSHQDQRLKEEGAKALEKICDPEAIIPLTEAMRILSKQMSKNKNKKRLFDSIVYYLTMGESFSTALAK